MDRVFLVAMAHSSLCRVSHDWRSMPRHATVSWKGSGGAAGKHGGTGGDEQDKAAQGCHAAPTKKEGEVCVPPGQHFSWSTKPVTGEFVKEQVLILGPLCRSPELVLGWAPQSWCCWTQGWMQNSSAFKDVQLQWDEVALVIIPGSFQDIFT